MTKVTGNTLSAAQGNADRLRVRDAREQEALRYRRIHRCNVPMNEAYLGHRMSDGVCIACGTTQAELNGKCPD